MTGQPRMTLSGVVLDTPDPRGLADFYRRLLGWTVREDSETWVSLSPPGGGSGISFQYEPVYVRPVWPSNATHQQMMLHLDIEVDDLGAGADHAVAAGATLAEYQPQAKVRVFLDPDGHPFCLWVR
jgi:catechol 2,3-dioxygenase-like lactoylglutathione lyase family enzyme